MKGIAPAIKGFNQAAEICIKYSIHERTSVFKGMFLI